MDQDGSATGQHDELEQRRRAALVWRKAEKAFKRLDYAAAADLLLVLIDHHGEHAAPVPPSELRALAGVTLLRLRRTEEGVEQLERAVEIEPRSARANYKLGLGYGRLRRQEDALAQFQRALEIDPRNVEYLCRLGLQFHRLKRDANAVAAYMTALEIDPTRDDAATALVELGVPDPVAAAAGACPDCLSGDALRVQSG